MPNKPLRSRTKKQNPDELQLKPSSVIRLTPEQQQAFLKQLQRPVRLTPAQKKLGRIMRGEA
jgi:hypothetical protein